MWRRDRAAGVECLRIGRHAVERWSSRGMALSLRSVHALPQDLAPVADTLAGAIAVAYPEAPGRPVTLLLESAWLPVMLIDVGSDIPGTAQLEALARHRFALHATAADPVEGWDWRIEHRPGSRHALAFGLAPRLRQALADAASATALRWDAMTPAFSWGLARAARRAGASRVWPRAAGWFVWPEQDRTLVARVAGRHVVGLDPAAGCASDEAAMLRLVDAERARWGLPSPHEPIVLATWNGAAPAPVASDRVAWFDVRGAAA